MNRSEKQFHFWSIFIIFSLAFACRILFDSFLQKNYVFYNFPSTDVSYYQAWAKDIVQGSMGATKTFFGLPLYPYFLATVYRLCLGNEQLVRFAHLILGSVNCCLIYWIAFSLFSKRIALLSGLLCALSFMGIYYDRLMMPPPLLVFLGAVFILLLIKQQQLSSKHHWFFLGILLGLSVLGDGKFLFFALLCCLYLMFKDKNALKSKLTNVIAPLLIGIFVVLACTGLRNKLIGGEWVWISAQSGLNFYYGNNPDAKGYYVNPDTFRPTHSGQDIDQVLVAQSQTGQRLSANGVSSFYKSKAINFIVNNPVKWSVLLLKKLHLFLIESEYTFDMDLIFLNFLKYRLDVNPFMLIAPMSLLGMFLARKKRDNAYLYFLIIAQVTFVLVFYLLNRYRATILPFLIIFESVAFVWLAEQIRQKKLTQLLSAFIFLFVFIFAFKPQFLDAKIREHLTFSKMGFAFEAKGDYTCARDAYHKALAIRPDDTSLLYNLANVSLKGNDYDAAEKLYLQVLDINPIQVDAYFNLGYVYSQKKRINLAIKAYESVIDLDPASIDAHYRLGIIYIQEKQCSKASDHFTAISSLNPSHQSELNQVLSTCNTNN